MNYQNLQDFPVRRKRKKTAKETAELLGVSERTIRNYIAQERSEYESEAKARRAEVANLREEGHKWDFIAEKMGASKDAVKALYQRYKRMQKAKQIEIDL